MSDADEMSVLMRTLSAGDAIVVGEGVDTIVIQVKTVENSERAGRIMRLAVIAPKSKIIRHARNGSIIGAGDDQETPLI